MRANKLIYVLALFSASSPALATELITNGSFEAAPIPSANGFYYPAFNGAAVTGWSFANTAALSNSASAWVPGNPFSGLGSVYAALQGAATLSTVFTAIANSGVLSWWDAGRPWSSGSNGNQYYQVSVVNQATGATAWSGSFNTSNSSAASQHVANLSLSAGANYILKFNGLVGSDSTAFIDGVSVTATKTVPGPIAGAGLPALLGILGLGACNRKRSRRADAAGSGAGRR